MFNVKIAGASLNQTPIKWKSNYQNIADSINEAKSKNIKILCLPELCISGYGCQDLFLHNWVIDKSLIILKKIIPLCSKILVVVGLPLKYKNELFNACCIIKNCKIIGFTVKNNLPNDGLHYESRWFKSWPLGKIDKIIIEKKTYPIGTLLVKYNNEIDIGIEICRDSWDNERPAKYFNTNKKLLILNPIASHFAFGKLNFWKDLVIKSSKKFNCTYLSCNLLGNEGGKIIFDGSIIASKKGKLIGVNNRFSFENFDLKVIDTAKYINYKKPNQFEEFSYAASLALFDYKRKSNCNSFLLSISGGMDSSLIAIIIFEMIKKSIIELGMDKFINRFKLNLSKKEIIEFKKLNQSELYKKITNKILTTVYQKSKNSRKKTFDSAKTISNYIGAKFYSWEINKEVKSITHKIENVLDKKLSWKNDSLAKQNIQARVRSPMIWMLANIKDAILLATSNRSESAVGYSTMDGDSSGSLAPIAGLDKLFIIDFLKYLYKNHNYKCLKKVLKLKPSAELLPKKMNQSDEDDLMPYKIMVKIERLAIKMKKSPNEIYKELSKSEKLKNYKIKKYIKKFFVLFSRNQWKRERYAPSFHFDDFSLDPNSWLRFPILSGNYEEELKNL